MLFPVRSSFLVPFRPPLQPYLVYLAVTTCLVMLCQLLRCSASCRAVQQPQLRSFLTFLEALCFSFLFSSRAKQLLEPSSS